MSVVSTLPQTQKTKLHKLRIWVPSQKKTKNTEKHQETMRSHIQSDRKANMMVMTELVRNIYTYNNKCTTPEHLPSPSECLAFTWLGVMTQPTNPTVTRHILDPQKIGIVIGLTHMTCIYSPSVYVYFHNIYIRNILYKEPPIYFPTIPCTFDFKFQTFRILLVASLI